MTIMILRFVVFVFLPKLSDCGESSESETTDEFASEILFNTLPENQIGFCYDGSYASIQDYYSPFGNDKPKIESQRYLHSFMRRNSQRSSRKCKMFYKMKMGGGTLAKKSIKPYSGFQNQVLQKRKNEAQTSLFQSTVPSPCACETRYRLLDLGHSYFPRYLPTAECQPLLFWNPPYACQEKFYKVQVIRKRKLGEEEQEDYTMPECLRNHWVVELQSVPVACECTT